MKIIFGCIPVLFNFQIGYLLFTTLHLTGIWRLLMLDYKHQLNTTPSPTPEAFVQAKYIDTIVPDSAVGEKK